MTSRVRLVGLLGGALLLHLLVLFAMATQLPDAHATGFVDDGHAAHAPLNGSGSTSQDPYFDLTPPEVRNLGGASLLEVLEAPPAFGVPEPVMPIDESWTPLESLQPDEHLATVRFGRAPPVR